MRQSAGTQAAPPDIRRDQARVDLRPRTRGGSRHRGASERPRARHGLMRHPRLFHSKQRIARGVVGHAGLLAMNDRAVKPRRANSQRDWRAWRGHSQQDNQRRQDAAEQLFSGAHLESTGIGTSWTLAPRAATRNRAFTNSSRACAKYSHRRSWRACGGGNPRRFPRPAHTATGQPRAPPKIFSSIAIAALKVGRAWVFSIYAASFGQRAGASAPPARR